MVKALRGRRRGQSLVEFALSLSLFLLLVMGVVDLGRGIFTYNMLSEAAREGARTGIADASTYATSQAARTAMCTEAINRVQAPGVASNSGCSSIADNSATAFGTLTVTVHWGTPGSTSDLDKTTLSYAFTPITPLIDEAINIANGSSITLNATSQMYVEQ
jgi:Flp pilus assembly protein TadG